MVYFSFFFELLLSRMARHASRMGVKTGGDIPVLRVSSSMPASAILFGEKNPARANDIARIRPTPGTSDQQFRVERAEDHQLQLEVQLVVLDDEQLFGFHATNS
jgi:hypothetical protein